MHIQHMQSDSGISLSYAPYTTKENIMIHATKQLSASQIFFDRDALLEKVPSILPGEILFGSRLERPYDSVISSQPLLSRFHTTTTWIGFSQIRKY